MNLPRINYEVIQLQGGLDQVTPTLSMQSGSLRRSANFECSINGGYTRIAGYERFDGRPSPSAATYTILTCSLESPVAVGDTLTGQDSGATAVIMAIDGNNIAVTKEVGFFTVDEILLDGMTPIGAVTSVAGVSADGLADAQFRNLAADTYREDIGAVPGSGPVRGVSYYKGKVYAWRNTTDGLAMKMYASSASGWVEVDLMATFDFYQGSDEIFAGETITGHTSGATALVKAVVVKSGTWSGGDAAGYIVFTNMTGTPTSGELVYVGGTKHARAVGTYTTTTLAPGGRVEAVVANFGGGPANQRIYGCDGVNRAFEFDGDAYVPIFTGMPVDNPTHVAVHKQHLFLSFGASLQFSAIGNPYIFDPVLGAGELALNGPVTNLLILPGDQSSGALGVYTRNDTSVLYGSSSEDFRLSTSNSGTGAIAYTAQSMDQAYVLDDRGVMAMAASDQFGNFAPASLTLNIRPYLQFRRNLATASSVNREKGQYRVFFSEGAGLYMTIANGRMLGSMPVQFPNAVRCCVEGENSLGDTAAFFGSDNGFVYQLDAGTSFDGALIPANINLVFNSVRSPRILKRYRRASVEITGDSYAQVQFAYDLGYGSTDINQAAEDQYSSDLRSSYWDEFVWDNFVWDGKEVSPTEIEMLGTAENIAIRISSSSDLFKPFTVNSIILHYSMRRGLR
jgi:hypothetical protein